jgi:hypothetical protein
VAKNHDHFDLTSDLQSQGILPVHYAKIIYFFIDILKLTIFIKCLLLEHMKPPVMNKISIVFSLAALFSFAANLRSSAQVLLTINDSDPSAVVITATGNNAGLDFNGSSANDGVDLLQFFTLDESGMTFGHFLTGTLQGGGTGISYNDVWDDNQSTTGGSALDAELYVDNGSPGSGNIETFSTTSPAFTGTWTIDMAALGVSSAALPTAGSSGNIMSGFSHNPGSVVGTWEVQGVPEPTTIGLASVGAAFAGLGLLRRRFQNGRK